MLLFPSRKGNGFGLCGHPDQPITTIAMVQLRTRSRNLGNVGLAKAAKSKE